MLKMRLTILWGLFCIHLVAASDVTWEQLSGPVGGVIVSQAFHKDGGHFALFDHSLNLSPDNGLSWQTVFENVLAFQIGMDGLVYVQSDDGLYFSPDGGVIWNKLPDGMYNINLDNMAIAADGTLYFADGANLHASQDRALSWQAVDYNFQNSADYVKIAQNGDIYVYGGGKAFASSDAETWREIIAGQSNIQDLFISSDNNIFASVGDSVSGVISRSTDGGQSWLSTTLPYAKKLYESPQGWLLGAGATREHAAAENSFISLNGGGSWSPIDVGNPVYNFAVNTQGVIFLGSDGFFRSTDSGGSFQPLSPNRAHVYALAAADNYLLAVTGTDSSFWRFWRSDNGGDNWSEIDKAKRLDDPDVFYALKAVKDERLWLVLGYRTDQDEEIDKNVIYETQNGGLTWKVVHELYSPRADFDFDKSTCTCFAWSYGARYFDRSDDFGGAWEPIPTPFEIGELHAASDGLLYAFSKGDARKIRRLYYSFDHGETWGKVDVPYDSGDAQLYVDHMGLLYKIVSQQTDDAFSLQHIYRSTDYGQSWNDIKPDSGLTAWDVAAPPAVSFDPLGGVYLYSPAYILLSRNAGLEWAPLYQSSATARDVQSLFAAEDGRVLAGFYSSSVRRMQKAPYLFHPQRLAGLEHPIAKTYGVMWVDYDADGDEDVFVVNDGPNFLYRNDGEGVFRKMTSGEIVVDDEPSRSASWADYNNDGLPDCYVTNWNAQNSLYKNLGGGAFKKITSGNIVEDIGGFRSCSWVDVNNDGHLDLYIANVSGKNILYINDGTNHFTKTNVDAIGGSGDETYGIGWCDFDADGDLDLYLANGGMDKLYEQKANGSFTLVDAARMPTNDGVAVGCSWGDYDNDGWMDLFVANADKENVLYRNKGAGSFSMSFLPGITTDDGVSKGSAWGDYDNDGDLDLFVSNNGSYFFYTNDGRGGFEKESMEEFVYYGGNSLAVAWGDEDNDGDLDLLLASFDLQTLQYENILETQNWVKVKCRGLMTTADMDVVGKSNRSAVGARIRLRAVINGVVTWQTRQVSVQTGHAGQNSIVQHFGVGDAAKIDSLVIYWPSGKVQRLADLSVNQRITVLESGSTAVVQRSENSAPVRFSLGPNYPNPFNPATTIAYDVPRRTHVKIEVFDTRGRLVQTLLNAPQPPGAYAVTWNGLDSSGRSTPSGLYFYVMTADDFRAHGKMTLLR